jgi:hypothetical protein
MPNPGVLTQFVSKSGSNSPSLSLYYDFESEDIQSRNLAADQIRPAPGAIINEDGNRLSSYKNLNVDVGGPIVKDKVWGYFAYLNQRTRWRRRRRGSFLDGTPFDTKLINYTGKTTYQMNQNNKLVGYLQHGTKQQPSRTDSSNRRRAGAHHRRLDHAAGLAELGLQGRVERHDRPEHVRRGPRRPVRLQLRARQQHRPPRATSR